MTQYNYGHVLRRFCVWTGTRVIDSELIERYQSYLMDEVGLKGWRTHFELRVLRQLFKWMIKMRYIGESPFKRAVLRRMVLPKRKEIISKAEYEMLKEKARGTPYYYLVILLYNTGLRIGDAIRLKWSDIDLDRQMIRIEPRKTKFVGTVADIPLVSGSDLASLLWEMYPSRTSEFVCPALIKKVNGELIASSVASNSFRIWVESCGLKGKSAHSFRRTFITNLMSGGVDSLIAMHIVGISGVGTLTHYVVPGANALRRAMVQGMNYATDNT